MSIFRNFRIFRNYRSIILLTLSLTASILFYYKSQQDSANLYESIPNFKTLKKAKLNSRYERLLIDPVCLKQIKESNSCKSPLNIASTNAGLENADLKVEYIIESEEGTDYLLLNGSTLRAIPKIDTIFLRINLNNGKNVEVSVAMDSKLFERYWEHSKFMESKKMVIKRENNKQNLNLEAASRVLRTMRKKIELFSTKFKQPMSVFIIGGTLLGWYRENTIIQHTNDIDFGMTADDLHHPDEFIKFIESTFYMRDTIGFANDSLELRFRSHGILTDLFIVYYDKTDPKKRDYYPGVDFGDKIQLKWYLPHIKKMCAGALLNSIVYVPCNVEEILKAEYGDWAKDKLTKNFDYAKSGQIRRGKKLTKKEWSKLVKFSNKTLVGKQKRRKNPIKLIVK